MVLSSGFQKVQNHLGGWSESRAIHDRNHSILSLNFENSEIHENAKFENPRKKTINFDREMLSSQTTHRKKLCQP